MAEKNVPYQAPWTDALQHRPDPNRVGSLQMHAHGEIAPAANSGGSSPAPPVAQSRSVPQGEARGHDPQSIPAEPSYYDIPLLQKPVWKWEIASYFFFGGVSAGAYLLSRAAERAGGDEYRDLTRAGAYVALLTLLPCPPLLIADLGDPKRFHHMLRIWKPSSPMNLGSWGLTAYGGMAAYEAARQYLQDRADRVGAADRNKILKLMNNGLLLLLHDAAGVPFSLLIASYTGVLLSCTANPLWCKNPWLSPLFTASAVSTGADAIALALDCTTPDRPGRESASHRVLRQVNTAAHAVEAVATAGFLKHAGEKAATLTRGKMRKHFALAVGGIAAAEVLKRLPVSLRYRKPVRMLASAVGLASGWSLRWSMIYGGQAAAADPHTSRLASRPGAEPKTPQAPLSQ